MEQDELNFSIKHSENFLVVELLYLSSVSYQQSGHYGNNILAVLQHLFTTYGHKHNHFNYYFESQKISMQYSQKVSYAAWMFWYASSPLITAQSHISALCVLHL